MNQLNVITADRLYGQPCIRDRFLVLIRARSIVNLRKRRYFQWMKEWTFTMEETVGQPTDAVIAADQERPIQSGSDAAAAETGMLEKISQDYSYVGLSFCANGNFSIQSEYWSKNVDAVCLQQKVFFTSQKYQLILVATHFLTHCSNLITSEVWGAYDKLNLDKWEQDPSLQKDFSASFYKYFLGLNKRASNVVARNEVGQTSLKPTTGLLH